MRASISTLAVGLVLAVLSPSISAFASSDAAWAGFDVRVTKACIQASGIRNARPSTIVGFDDRVGLVAMLVSDRKRGSTLSKLCLYDKKAQKAYVDDADTWSAPPQPR